MKSTAWAALTLGLLLGAPQLGVAQDARPGPAVQLGRNYPNPFNPETFIPFTVSQAVFANGHKPVVSLRIYNILAQLVAVPVIQGSGQPLVNVKLDWNGTGNYTAYWDGTVIGSGQPAASGVYVYQLVVDGTRLSQKMTIAK
jgi:hypothetical protein